MLSWVRPLTVSTLRLNSRNYVRDRSTTDNPENAVNLSTIRIEPSGDDHKLRSGQPGVSVTVHRSTRFDFGRSISDHDEEPTFDVAKPVRYLHLLVTPILILIILSAGCKSHRFSQARSNVRLLSVGCCSAIWGGYCRLLSWGQSLDTARYLCTPARFLFKAPLTCAEGAEPYVARSPVNYII